MSSLLIIFVFANFCFGFRRVVRILNSSALKTYFSRKDLTKIGTAILATQLIFAIKLKDHPEIVLFCIHIFALSLWFLKKWTKRRIETRLQQEFCCVLSNTLLLLKVGYSFNKSMELSLKQLSAPFDRLISKQITLSFLSIPQDLQSLAKELKALKHISEQKQYQMKQLKRLKDSFEQKLIFRHKSGTILARTWIQVTFLSLIQVSVSALLISKSSTEFIHLLILSYLFFFIGVGLLRHQGSPEWLKIL